MVAGVTVRFCLAVAVFCPGCGPGCLYSHMLACAPSSSKEQLVPIQYEVFQCSSARFIVLCCCKRKPCPLGKNVWKLLELGFDTQEAFSFKDEKVFDVFAEDFFVGGLEVGRRN